jgi:hypothetical protein
MTPVPVQVRPLAVCAAAEGQARPLPVSVVAAPAAAGYVLMPGYPNRVGYLDSAWICDAARGGQVFEMQAQG